MQFNPKLALSFLLTISMLVVSCSQSDTLEILNSTINADSYTYFLPSEKASDPRSDYGEYYLVSGKEGLLVREPSFSHDAARDLFFLDSESITFFEHSPTYVDEGFSVRVNDRLQFTVYANSLEDDMALSRVKISLNGNEITPEFYFAGTGNGETDVIILAMVDGVEQARSEAYTMEIRPE